MNTAYHITTQLRKLQKKEKELKGAEDIAEIHTKMADLLADIRKFPNLSLSHSFSPSLSPYCKRRREGFLVMTKGNFWISKFSLLDTDNFTARASCKL